MISRLIPILLGILCGIAPVHALVVGEELPDVEVADRGELVLQGNEVVFRAWSSNSLRGRWILVQHLAARPGPSGRNFHVLEALAGSELDLKGFLEIVNIINVDDVTLGATGFALRELKKNKLKHPESTLIADMDTSRGRWGLERENAALVLLDPDGRVRFFNEGRVGDAELEALLNILSTAAGEREAEG